MLLWQLILVDPETCKVECQNIDNNPLIFPVIVLRILSRRVLSWAMSLPVELCVGIYIYCVACNLATKFEDLPFLYYIL